MRFLSSLLVMQIALGNNVCRPRLIVSRCSVRLGILLASDVLSDSTSFHEKILRRSP